MRVEDIAGLRNVLKKAQPSFLNSTEANCHSQRKFYSLFGIMNFEVLIQFKKTWDIFKSRKTDNPRNSYNLAL